MLLSVIIPVFNSAKTIKQCISSVVFSVEKVTSDYEIICINDGSTDNTLSILEGLKLLNSKLIIISQENQGVAVARNKGLQVASGQYIAFNDSDDVWIHDHFYLLYSLMINYPYIDCVSGNHEVERQRIISIKKYEDDTLVKVSLTMQLFKNYFSPPNTIIKRSIIDSGVRFHSDMKYAEEGFFFNWIAKDFNAYFFNKKLGENILHKKRFGDRGLSGNLYKMEKGEIFNIWYAYKYYKIPFFIYIGAVIFSLMKYIRRILIVIIRRMHKDAIV